MEELGGSSPPVLKPCLVDGLLHGAASGSMMLSCRPPGLRACSWRCSLAGVGSPLALGSSRGSCRRLLCEGHLWCIAVVAQLFSRAHRCVRKGATSHHWQQTRLTEQRPLAASVVMSLGCCSAGLAKSVGSIDWVLTVRYRTRVTVGRLGDSFALGVRSGVGHLRYTACTGVVGKPSHRY